MNMPFSSFFHQPILLFCLLYMLFPSAVSVLAQEKVNTSEKQWPKGIRQAFEFESPSAWSTGEIVVSPSISGQGALKWDQHTNHSRLNGTVSSLDLSDFNVISFWLHSRESNGATFMVILPSSREENTFSYYAKKVTVDWKGWKKIELHFQSFESIRDPAGWDSIDSIRFSAGGWGQTPTDGSEWILDKLAFHYTSEPYVPEIHVKKYVQEPKPEEFLTRLRRQHPRLILLDEHLPSLRAFIENDPRGPSWYENTKEKAERLYHLPVSKHRLPDGRRLLSISRNVLDRIYHWGFIYRMEGDRKWLDRAWRELEAVVSFPDWNPSHYLDTAEMMHAVAIGYDWFYNDLTDKQRALLEDGLWQHGLRLSHAAYFGLEAEGMQGWRANSNNWNFVCNGGTGLAAMALLDKKPEQCADILNLGFQYIQIPLEHFEPDGAWWEGVTYWGYAMRYFVPYLRGLETAFGTDFGFIDQLQGTGFEHAGDFPVYLTTPLGSIYNFADSGSGSGTYRHSHLFYLANRFDQPLYEFFQLRQTSGGLNDLLYFEPLNTETTIEEFPLDRYFRKTEVATMRSAWSDPNALFVGIKCGKNGIAHAHQDLGSFIFYALGEKWFVDLGSERQTYLRHQHGLPRSHFYRIREEGHNTLVIAPEKGYSQDPKAMAEIIAFKSTPEEVFAIADLTDAYREHAESAQRGYRLFQDRSMLLIQDELMLRSPQEVWWFAHGTEGSKYEIAPSGKMVMIRRRDKECRAYLLSPPDAKLSVRNATPLPSSPNPDIQKTNEGVQKLAIHLDHASKSTIAVLIVPGKVKETTIDFDKILSPLNQW
jgi:hypothetical protein